MKKYLFAFKLIQKLEALKCPKSNHNSVWKMSNIIASPAEVQAKGISVFVQTVFMSGQSQFAHNLSLKLN